MRSLDVIRTIWIAGLLPWVIGGCEQKAADPEILRAERSATASGQLMMDSVGAIGLEHQLTIGAADGAPEYAFGRIVAVAPRDDGGFFVCDGHDTQVRLYDSDGRYLLPVGKRGRGPAEYLSCGSMLVLGDTLAISDVHGRRIVRFDLRSGDSKTIPVPSNHAVISSRSDGTIGVLENRAGRAPGERAWNVMVLYSQKGEVLDSFELPSLRRPVGFSVLVASTENGELNPRLEDSLFAVVPSGGALVARASDYRVELRNSPDVRILTRNVPALPYLQAERDEWQRILEWHPAQPQLQLPERKPRIRELRADDVGRAWVRLSDTAYQRIAPQDPASAPRRPRLTHVEQGVWDLFDLAKGDYIGQLRLPLGHSLSASHKDRVWLLSTGEDGQLLLSVYRLRAAK